ncbi:unnamed protein product [Callosobruchus maculatus]|uniref:Uncharacterized protein n=1 Tax=Callosobruchus maculatus TaxID=64391 RepID=A0A653CZ10_CALMS|nr:unnamed protein product [Callosobruchus maculatus]
MDSTQTKASYSHLETDNDLPVKEDNRMGSHAKNESLGVDTTRSSSVNLREEVGDGNYPNSSRQSSRNGQHNNESLGAGSTRGYSSVLSSGNFDEFGVEMGDGHNATSSRRSSRNSQHRSSVENVIDNDNGYRTYSNQERQECYDDCCGNCRNQNIQTGPASILKSHPYSTDRCLGCNQTNNGGRYRDMGCPFMRVVSDQTTNAATSGYSIYNIPCDCQKVIMTSNKKLQTSETNLTGNNVRYYCKNAHQQNSSQTVALQDIRGETNISQCQGPSVQPECRCCPETRKKSTNEYQCSQAALTEYNQPSPRCLENKCERVETYLNGVESDGPVQPTDFTAPECRCCPSSRSKAVYKHSYQQEEYQQPHMESGGRRYCVQGSYSNESESPECCQPCPGYTSTKRRTGRSITCNPSLTPRSFLCSTRFSPSEFGDFNRRVPQSSPKRRNKRCPYLEHRRMTSLEPPPWSSPEYRKPKTKCTCNCCCRGDTAPPPPPLPEFFCCPDEEDEDDFNQASDICDEDDCFCDDLGSPTGLSYQDNEEYQELLTELEEALACRNRNRVRRAIQEFEQRSRLNKPLERPIIDYDDTSGSEEPLIEKLSQLRNSRKANRRRADRPSATRRRSKTREENEYSHEEQTTPCSSGRQFRTGSKREGSRLPKWKMDEAGEWYKSPRTLKRSSGSSSPRKDYHTEICGCCACKACDRMK